MMDRWKVYEMLKGHIEPDAAMIEMMDPDDVKEGVIEYLIQRGREADGRL